MEPNIEKPNFISQRYFSNYFEIDYLESNSDKKISELIFIQNFDTKITYLLQRFSYPYLIKIILKKLKFSHFQEKIILEDLRVTLEKDMEEHELSCLIHEVNTFTSNSYHLECFEGHFYGNHSQVHYRMRNHQKIDHRCIINFRNFGNTHIFRQ